MTVAVEIPEVVTVASDGQLVFPITFSFTDDEQILVTVTTGDEDPVEKVRGVDYGVEGDGLAGTGEVIFVSLALGPEADDVVTVRRSTPLEQPDSFGNQGALTPERVGLTFDKFTRIAQELAYFGGSGAGEGGGGGGIGTVPWNNVSNKPTSFTPSAHSHAISGVTGLQAALDAKAASDLANVGASTFKTKMTASGAVTTASGAGFSLPDLAAGAGKTLRVNGAGTGVEYYTPSGGGGGTGDVDSVNGQGADSAGNVALGVADIPGALGVDMLDSEIQVAASGETLSLPAIINRQLTLLKFIPYAQWPAILDRTASVSHSTYIQEALDEAEDRGGARIEVEAGLYRTNKPLRVASNTLLRGEGQGSIIRSIHASWDNDGVSADFQKCQFINKNYTAGAITDENIIFEHLHLDHNLEQGHMMMMRMVDRPRAHHTIFRNSNGGDGTAFLGTKDSVILDCMAIDCQNSGFDHWDGFVNAKVIGCTVRGCEGQGIQFTGTATDYANRQSYHALVMGCHVYDVHHANPATPYGVGIIFNVVDAGSAGYRGRSVGNFIHDCDIGIVFGGHGDGHMSVGDTISNVLSQPFLIQDEEMAGDGEVPNGCVIDGLHLIDCDHTPAAVAMIALQDGDDHVIRGLKVTGGLHTNVIWLSAETADCIVHPFDVTPGGSTIVSNFGVGNKILGRVEKGSASGVAFSEIYSPNGTYRAKIGDAGSLNFNGLIQAGSAIQTATDLGLAASGLIVYGLGGGEWFQKIGQDIYWRQTTGPTITKLN